MIDVDLTTDSKERLLQAGEYLFARHGILGSRAREISHLAGLRNPSALHYHFGSRGGLLEAILLRYQSAIDIEVEERLDALEREAKVITQSIIHAALATHIDTLETARGRNCARILPYMISTLTTNLRRGVFEPTTAQTRRVLTLLEQQMGALPVSVRRERLALYSLIVSHALAERATELEHADASPVTMDAAQFLNHLVGILGAMIDAPVPVPARSMQTGGVR